MNDTSTKSPMINISVEMRAKIGSVLDRYGILILIAIMMLVLHILQPDVFFTWRNLTNVFKQTAWQATLALGMFIVIVTAGIDLSVGSILMLSLMALAITSKAGFPWIVVMVVPIIVGVICASD